ncbi:DUF433 domain-containing protein [Leptolyngbya subtilissima]
MKLELVQTPAALNQHLLQFDDVELTMMTLDQLQTELLALSPQEKAQVIQLLVSSLSGTWVGIEKTPGVMGGDACIRQTRIPVWLLVSLRQQGATEAFLLEDYPDLTAADLTNAWLYASTHQSEIEVALQRQAAA